MKYAIGAASMLLIVSLVLNFYLIGQASRCLVVPATMPPVELK